MDAAKERGETDTDVKRSGFWRGCLVALRIAAALAILWILVAWLEPQAVAARIATCPLPAALASFATALFAQWLAALRLQRLAASQCVMISLSTALNVNLSAVFYSLFLPGGSASSWAVKTLQLSPRAANVGSILFVLAGDRAITTAVGAGIGLLAACFMSGHWRPIAAIVLLGVGSGATLVSLTLFTSLLDPWLNRAEGMWGLRKLVAYLRQHKRSAAPGRSRTVVAAIALSAALHIAGVLSWSFLARGLGLDVGPLALAWARSAAAVVSLLPATVGGLGLREGAVVYLLAPLGVPGVDAFSLSMLVFAVTVLGIGMVGGLLEAYRLLSPEAARKD